MCPLRFSHIDDYIYEFCPLPDPDVKCLAGNKCVDLVHCPLQYCELCPNSGGIYKETDASRYATMEIVVLGKYLNKRFLMKVRLNSRLAYYVSVTQNEFVCNRFQINFTLFVECFLKVKHSAEQNLVFMFIPSSSFHYYTRGHSSVTYRVFPGNLNPYTHS